MNILEEVSYGIQSFDAAESLFLELLPNGRIAEFKRLRGPIGERLGHREAAERYLEVWLEYISFKNNRPLTCGDKKRKLSDVIDSLPRELDRIGDQWKNILKSQYNSPKKLLLMHEVSVTPATSIN